MWLASTYVILDTNAPREVPHARSTRVTASGQFLSVAKFVRSYVAYVMRPKNAPKSRAWVHDALWTAGRITKSTRPPIKRR